MSGTTAISSFSMVEAEMLEAHFILRHLPKLYDISTEFLAHLAPENARIEDDYAHIQEMQKPDSFFTQEYRDFNAELNLRLDRFRTEHQQYIRLRAIRRALLGPDRDPGASRSGLDLIIYLANLAIFTRQMIGSNRGEKEIWDALRELDSNQFPHIFLPALVNDTSKSVAGESGLTKETFELALELRTQLAVLVLERASIDGHFNPDESLEEVFFRSEGESTGSIVRGWDTPGLGGDNDELPANYRDRIVNQMNKIRRFFPTDTQSLEQGEAIDLEGLAAEFSWESAILQVLQWVRLRHKELQVAIGAFGGMAMVIESVKHEIDSPETSQNRAASVPRESPRKTRRSFGRDRRRSSRKFDPHDTSNDAGVLALMARERGLAGQPPVQPTEETSHIPQEAENEEEFPPLAMEEDLQEQLRESSNAEPSASAPPRSTNDFVKMVKDSKRQDKENRGSFFDRQANARRIEFGDGFDNTQPTPGPSGKGKEPQRSPRKRRQPPIEEESDDDDAFETGQRSAQASERRQRAPVAKRVRISDNIQSSAAPPSHQPLPRNAGDQDYVPEAQDESVSEGDAPEMTEEIPASSYAHQKQAAKVNVKSVSMRKPPQNRTRWTPDAEEAFQEYMSKFPQKYAEIHKYDASNQGYGLLQDRTQVNLKDKAINMAITMIK
jgi:hypothetical protein